MARVDANPSPEDDTDPGVREGTGGHRVSLLVSALRLGTTLSAVGLASVLVWMTWHRREEPTARTMLAVGVAMLLGALAHLVVADLTEPHEAVAATGVAVDAVLWMALSITTASVGGLCWFLFALRYTGRDRSVYRVAVAATVLLSAVAVLVPLVVVLVPGLTSEMGLVLTPLFLVSTSLVALGAFLVVGVSIEQAAFPVPESVSLASGGVVLVFAPNVAQIFDRPEVFSAMLTLAAGAFVVAVWRYPIFETLPAARVLGRDRVIEELADAVVVVDRDGRIRDLNPAAEAAFGVDGDPILGRPLSAVVDDPPDPASAASAEEPVPIETPRGRTLAATVDHVGDDRERPFGYLLICEDRTDRRIRERRLAVLNGLLIDTVRRRMTLVIEDATRLVESDDGSVPPDRVGDRIWERTTELTELVARTREIERAIASGGTDEGDRTDLAAAVLDVTAPFRTDDDGPLVRVTTPEGPVYAGVSEPLVRAALATVVTDAVTRATDAVHVGVVVTDSGPTIHVVDDRSRDGDGGASNPGATDELTVAVAQLAAEHAGGGVAVRSPPSGGRQITIRLPSAPGREERMGSPSRDRRSAVVERTEGGG